MQSCSCDSCANDRILQLVTIAFCWGQSIRNLRWLMQLLLLCRRQQNGLLWQTAVQQQRQQQTYHKKYKKLIECLERLGGRMHVVALYRRWLYPWNLKSPGTFKFALFCFATFRTNIQYHSSRFRFLSLASFWHSSPAGFILHRKILAVSCLASCNSFSSPLLPLKLLPLKLTEASTPVASTNSARSGLVYMFRCPFSRLHSKQSL